MQASGGPPGKPRAGPGPPGPDLHFELDGPPPRFADGFFVSLFTLRVLLIIIIKLRLLPNAYYERTSINLLISNLNKHTTTQDYAIIKDRNKMSKQDIYIKY